MPAQRLIADRYSLIEPLPGSATAIAWRAQDLWSGQLVVLTPVPLSSLADHQRARHDIASDARALGRVRHDRLAQTADVVLDADELWVASEPLPGVTLAEELARRGAVGPEQVARWGRDVAAGLAAAHRAGALHRNLHAGVVGIAHDGRAVVGGFATTPASEAPVHLAPEVAGGAAPSPAADVFALGAMLYVAVEGRRPFPAAADSDPAGAVAVPRRAGWLSDPLMRMLHPDPAQRPTAAVVADRLRQLAHRPPSARQRERIWLLVATAVVAVLMLASGLPSPAWRRVLPPATPAPLIGNPRTADPCGLLSMGSVQQFGQPTMFRDLGYPQSCVIDIRTGGDGFVRLAATLGDTEDHPPAGSTERFRQLTIIRQVGGAGSCRRTVVLGDRSRVYVTAWAFRGAAAELCTVADAGTQTAVSALSGGSLPRRDLNDPPHALTRVDTCSLLDQAALKQVPGLDSSRRDPGFAGWLCTWGGNPAFRGEPQVLIAVERAGLLSGRPVQIGGRSAQVNPGGSDNAPGTCVVELVQRSYRGTSGYPRVELLRVSVSLGVSQPTDAACRSAIALAEAAAPKLPPA